MYHDIRGSVDADYMPPKTASASKPIAKKKKKKLSKKVRPSDAFAVSKTIRDRNKEIDIRKFIK